MNISLECLRGQFKKKFGLELFNFSEEKKFELRYIKKDTIIGRIQEKLEIPMNNKFQKLIDKKIYVDTLALARRQACVLEEATCVGRRLVAKEQRFEVCAWWSELSSDKGRCEGQTQSMT